MPAYPTLTGTDVEDTRPLSEAEIYAAAVRDQIEADPIVKEARQNFPNSMAAIEAGDWDAAEICVVREITSYLSNSNPNIDLQLNGLYEWGQGGQQDPQLAVDLQPGQRLQIVGMGRNLAIASPPVHNALRLGTSYVIGQGIPMPVSSDADVQGVISDEWDDPDNFEFASHEGQKETDRQQRIAGELFVVVAVADDGHCKWRTVDTMRVADVVPHPEDRCRPLYYRVQTMDQAYDFGNGAPLPMGGTPEYVYYPDWRNVAPPDDSDEGDRDPYRNKEGFKRAPDGMVMAHFPLNKIGGLRGIPDMAAAVVWVVEHKRFMDARVMIMQALAKISMIKTVKGGPQQVQASAALERSSLANSPFQGLERNPTGVAQVYTKSQGVDIDFPKFDTGASGATQDLEALAQMVGTAFGLPTHYILMSTETSRLATAVAMELPVLKMYEDRQSAWRDMLRDLIDYALVQAAKASPKRIKAPVVYRHGHEMIDWDRAEPSPDKVTMDGTPVKAIDADAAPVKEADMGDLRRLLGLPATADDLEAQAALCDRFVESNEELGRPDIAQAHRDYALHLRGMVAAVKEADGGVPMVANAVSPLPPAPVMPTVMTGKRRADAQKSKANKARGGYDVSMPKILARDIPASIQAVDTAAKGGYITQEQAARMAYELFNVDDVSDAMLDWEQAVDLRLEQHNDALDQANEEKEQQQQATSQKADQDKQESDANVAKTQAETQTMGAQAPSSGAKIPSGGMSR